MAVPDEEWLALGRAFEEAQRRSRTRARQLADHLINVDAPAARENLSGTYLEGRTTGWEAYARDLGVPDDIDEGRLQAWVQEAAVKSTDMMDRLIATVENRDEVMRVFIDNYANVATNNTLWEGIDESGVDVARLAEAQYKTWVRSWARKQQRDWHSMLEGRSILIEEQFVLPGGPNAGVPVDGPRDWQAVNDAREHINCGHALRFSVTIDGDAIYEPPTPEGGATPVAPVIAPPPVPAPVAPPAPPRSRYEQLQDEIEEAFRTPLDQDLIARLVAEVDAVRERIREGERSGMSYKDLTPLYAERARIQEEIREAKRAPVRAVHEVIRRNRAGAGVTVTPFVPQRRPGYYPRPNDDVNLYETNSKGKLNVEASKGRRMLGERIERARTWVEDHVSTEHVQPVEVQFMTTKRSRAYQSMDRVHLSVPGGRYIEESGSFPQIIVHEIAHRLEELNPDVYRATIGWRERRTAGERERRLRDITGIRAYEDHEVSKPDNFYDPYVGKPYDDRNSEVFSMGLDYMYQNPVEFAQKDREHFDLILSIITGTLRESPFYVPPRATVR